MLFQFWVVLCCVLVDDFILEFEENQRKGRQGGSAVKSLTDSLEDVSSLVHCSPVSTEDSLQLQLSVTSSSRESDTLPLLASQGTSLNVTDSHTDIT